MAEEKKTKRAAEKPARGRGAKVREKAEGLRRDKPVVLLGSDHEPVITALKVEEGDEVIFHELGRDRAADE